MKYIFIILFVTISFNSVALIAPTNTLGLIVLPNAITPNGDLMNDDFKVINASVLSIELVNNFKVVIYNRWGQEVFSSNDLFFKWGAQEQELGNFVYYIQYTDAYKQQRNFKGNLMIIK